MEKKAPKPSYNSAYGYGNSSTGSNSRYATAPPGLSPWYASSAGNNVQQPEAQATLQRKYSRIGDDYRTVTQVCIDGLPWLPNFHSQLLMNGFHLDVAE